MRKVKRTRLSVCIVIDTVNESYLDYARAYSDRWLTVRNGYADTPYVYANRAEYNVYKRQR